MNSLNIKNRLTYLNSHDTSENIFGSSSHHYFIFPKISEKNIGIIENKLSIRIPEEYKYYLTNISGGGVGPGYGLQWLESIIFESLDNDNFTKMTIDQYFSSKEAKKWAQSTLQPQNQESYYDINRYPSELPQSLKDKFELSHKNKLSQKPINFYLKVFINNLSRYIRQVANNSDIDKPFPFTKPIDGYRNISRNSVTIDEDEADREWLRLWKQYDLDRFRNGTIPICSYGHEVVAILVVNGDEYGNVWILDSENLILEPFGDNWAILHSSKHAHSNRYNFIEWFLHWLDSSELLV
ncbi:MAG: SMI1/KNR4 family protein [Candidatus Thiodiazotropha sp.]